MELSGLKFHEQVVMLALDEKRGSIVCADYYLHYTIVGAIITELLLESCIYLEPKTNLITYRQPYPGDNLILREALDLVFRQEKPKEISFWLDHLKWKLNRLTPRIIEDLIRKGILEEREDKFLFFKYKSYPSHDPVTEHVLKEKIRFVVLNKENSDMRLVVVARLAKACELFGVIFRPEDMRAAIANVAKLEMAFGIDKAVHEAIEVINACIMSCVITATAAATINN